MSRVTKPPSANCTLRAMTSSYRDARPDEHPHGERLVFWRRSRITWMVNPTSKANSKPPCAPTSRPSQVSGGHDMDDYAADAAAVAEHLDLKDAVHVGHSTGGGEVARYVAQYGQPQGRVAKAVLISSVPPLMLKTEGNPDGTPIEVFDGFRKALGANRSQFCLDIASGPFYGFNRFGSKVSQGVIQNWWRQGMNGSAKAHYEGIRAFSETDQTEDLKEIKVPTFVMQGDDDQIVPYKDASLLQAKLLKKSTLKVYPGFPDGMCTVNADVTNSDLLAFIRS